jgi:hypothetical protein
LFSFQTFPSNCVAVITFGNSILFSILGDGVCM